jgi:hypothetical protein
MIFISLNEFLKNNDMKYFLLMICLAVFVSCKNDKKETTPEVKTVDMEAQVHEPAELQAKFKDSSVGEAYRGYVNIKSALVNSDVEKTHKSVEGLAENLQKMEHSERMGDIVSEMSKAKDLEILRRQFQYLTEEMLKLTEAGLDSGQLYYQYCPMAFEGKGGYWLSNGKEVRNPYFGDKMLKCGSVARVIE